MALLSLLYTAGMYWWRVQSIRCADHLLFRRRIQSPLLTPKHSSFRCRKRRAVNYHDVYGPTALCGALLVAVIVNFSLRFKQLD